MCDVEGSEGVAMSGAGGGGAAGVTKEVSVISTVWDLFLDVLLSTRILKIVTFHFAIDL